MVHLLAKGLPLQQVLNAQNWAELGWQARRHETHCCCLRHFCTEYLDSLWEDCHGRQTIEPRLKRDMIWTVVFVDSSINFWASESIEIACSSSYYWPAVSDVAYIIVGSNFYSANTCPTYSNYKARVQLKQIFLQAKIIKGCDRAEEMNLLWKACTSALEVVDTLRCLCL